MAEAIPIASEGPRVKIARAPGAGHAVWTIAVRELMDALTSVRFLVIALLVVGLTPLTVYVGTQDYADRLADFSRLAAERQALAAGLAGKRVTGIADFMSAQNALSVVRALRVARAAQRALPGLGRRPGGILGLFTRGIEAGPSASRPQRLADLLGQLDLEFLVRVVLGLLAILLAFDAVAGEKELGTLRAVLSQPIPRSAFLGGKLAGSAITLLVPLSIVFLSAPLYARQFGIDLLGSDALSKITLLAATSGAYLVCFYALGLLISALTASQKTSLVVVLVVWVLAVLAVPPLGTLVAQAVSPVPPVHALQAEERALDDRLSQEAAQAMGVVYREITGLPEDWVDSSKYEQHKEAINRRIAPIVVAYVNKRRQLVGELEREAERRSARQNEVARVIMAMSPAAVFAGAAADLAGTGDADCVAWLEAVRRYQSRLDTALFDDPPTVTIQNGRGTLWVDRRDPPSVAGLPPFVPPRRDAAAALARAFPALGLLALYAGLFVLGGFVVFARYDVR